MATMSGTTSLFDDAMMRNAGITPPPQSKIHDTRYMHHPLESRFSTALKPLATRYVDAQAGAAQADLDEAIRIHGWDGIPVDFVPYWSYAAVDPVLTTLLDDVLRPRVMAECPKAYDLELSVSWTTHRMERYGVHIDTEYTRRSQGEFDAYIQQAEDWCVHNYGVKPGSNQAIIDILVSEGYDFTKRTEKGALCLDREVLSGIDHPLARTVLQRRQLQKLSSGYLTGFLRQADSDDLVHCSVNSIGADTGRMTMTKPALQTLPRLSESNRAAITVRDCVSARPGNTLLMCDFDQIEMRVLAYLSKDPRMLEAFLTGRDFFISMACTLYNLEDMAKSDPLRNLTKTSLYGMAYGSGVDKLAQSAHVTPGEASAFMKKFNGMFPGVPEFIGSVAELAAARFRDEGSAYMLSPFTGRRHTADRWQMYALVNYQIQGLAAEIFKMKVLEIEAVGLGEWLSLLVHDEVILDVPDEHVPYAVRMLDQVMNDDNIIAPVPVTASVSYGQRWGSKRGWDLDEWKASLAA